MSPSTTDAGWKKHHAIATGYCNGRSKNGRARTHRPSVGKRTFISSSTCRPASVFEARCSGGNNTAVQGADFSIHQEFSGAGVVASETAAMPGLRIADAAYR